MTCKSEIPVQEAIAADTPVRIFWLQPACLVI